MVVAILLLAGGLGTELLVSQERARLQQQAVQQGYQRVYALRSRIETELSASLYLASGVEAFIRANRGALDQDEIRRVLAILYARSQTIRNIGIAPGNRIAHVHPLAGNERALGLFYPDNPQQWPAIEKVIRLRTAFLAGPVVLVQGGEGLVYRVPVFLDDGSYWGLISTVIDTARLWKRTGVSELLSGEIHILGKDAQGIGGDTVFGRMADAMHALPLHIDIAVPGGSWRLLGKVPPVTDQGSVLLIRSAGWGVTFLLALGMFQILLNARRLTRLNAELERARDLAEAASRSRAAFLAVMSHEVRTPLNGIMGMTQLLTASGLSTVQADYARTASSCAESLLVMMDDILDYTLVDSGALQLKPEMFELLPLIEECAEPFALQARDKGLEFCWSISPALPLRGCADPVRIRQILGHVLANAIKFTSNGAIGLAVMLDELRPEFLHLTVRDTGIGIRPEDVARLFEPFHQLDASATRRFGGSGLGLSLCHRLLGLMGGRIDVDSQPGQGSSFHLRIPLSQQEGRLTELKAPALKGGTVLLVSASGALRASLEPWLLAWGGHLRCAADGHEALAELDRLGGLAVTPVLTILDIAGLPAGEAFLQRLETDGRLQSCACIRLLAPGSLHVSPSGNDLRRTALLNKPVRPERLARLIDELLTAPEPLVLAETGAAQDAGLSYRVLLVEDNVINQKVALAMLGLLRVRVETAFNGHEAIAALSRSDFDLVLMDLQMPEMDGLSATRLIRDPSSGVRRHDIPIVALTANALETHREECLEAGMNDYLSKPLSQERLLKMLETYLPGLAEVRMPS